ncbi:MAG: hypothetical protein QNL61_05040 [Crocinitomicaceae bacterium]
MKTMLLLLLLLSGLSLTSCTSEYEECVKEGITLKKRLIGLESNDLMISGDTNSIEAKEIYNEINLLAKVSGNEQLFLQEVFSN